MLWDLITRLWDSGEDDKFRRTRCVYVQVIFRVVQKVQAGFASSHFEMSVTVTLSRAFWGHTLTFLVLHV